MMHSLASSTTSHDSRRDQLNYLNDKNPTKAKNVMQAMMKMQKIDIKHIKQAYQKK
jgi:hypothetical protein